MAKHTFDLTRAREETPGCKNVLHFNNAGASLMPEPVLHAVIQHLKLESEIGGYEAAARQSETIENVYDVIAKLIESHRNEIAVIENATRAWDMAFYSIPFKPGDRILTSIAEYASNYIAFLQIAEKTGAKIDVIPNDDNGQLSVDTLQEMLDDSVKLIAVTHVPTNGGLVNPAAEIGKIAREHETLFLLDACQSIGQMPISVKDIGCDMLSATSRKYLRGPRGSGFLYIKQDLVEKLDPPFLDLHAAEWVAHNQYKIRDDARRFENWETNYAAKIGLGAAVEYATSWGLDTIWDRISLLAKTLRSQLNSIPGVNVHDQGKTQCGIVTFTVEGWDSQKIRESLAEVSINVSVSLKASTRLDMEHRQLSNLVRASVHYYNSEEEIARFCETLSSIISN